MSKPTDAAITAARFEAPSEATPLTTRPAWIMLYCVAAVAVAFVFALHDGAYWPTPIPIVSIVALAFVFALASPFGTFETVGGLAEYASLGMPIAFAMLLVLDWHGFCFAIVLSEAFNFASDTIRRQNKTIWYIRGFNIAAQIIAGGAADTVLRIFKPVSGSIPGGSWLSAGPAIALICAAITWKLLDSVQSSTMIALAARLPLSSAAVPVRTFLSQLALFSIAIPFALLWQHNVWLALFALAPLGVAYRLLGLPELEHRARTDERTGLMNASAFDRVIASAIEGPGGIARGRCFALFAIDIDHFKAVNDTYGHLVGDGVIARFASILAEAARYDDVAARMGGEEFALLLRDADRTAALAFAERLRERVELQKFDVDGVDVPIAVTVSIGVAFFPQDGKSARDLFKISDEALYAAKRGGRNNVREKAHVEFAEAV